MPTAAFIQHALDQKKPFALFSTKAKVGLQSTYAERLAARYLDVTGENIDKRFALWSRLEGGVSLVGSNGSSSDVSYGLAQGRIEAGVDVVLAHLGSGTLYAGLSGSIGQSTMTSEADSAHGSAETDTKALGGSITFAGRNGFYADAQLKHIWFKSDIADCTDTALADKVDATANIAGLELGKRFATSERVSVTPQAQLVYAKLNANDFANTTTDIIFEDAESLTLRVGMAAEAALGADGEMGQIRILANVTHEFMGDRQGMAGTTAFDRDRTDWAGELGMGFACGNTFDGISLHGGATLASDMDEMGTATPPKETLACG